MKCPKCESTHFRKNGRRGDRQNYLCKNCGRQFTEPDAPKLLQNTEIDAVLVSNNGHSVTPQVEATILTVREKAKVDNSASTIAQEFLKVLSSPEFLESSTFQQFIQKIQRPTENLPQAKDQEIAILLLDTENLKLDSNIEKFLGTLCKYPLQVKIAFANWRNPTIGKQDAELYERGYQLIHVPSGNSSADAKMIAIGSSLFLQYPKVKEVFVCSGDWLLTHLCNQLQNLGINVYWVRRQDNTLKVENCQTGELNYYSIALKTEIPSFEELAQKIEDIIKVEEQAIADRLQQLSTVATLFQEQRQLTILNQPGLLQKEQIAPEEKSTESVTEKKEEEKSDTSQTKLPTPATRAINSREEFEQGLILCIQRIKIKSPDGKVTVAHLGTEFRAVYKKAVSSVIQKLGLGSSFNEFLQSCSAFKIIPNEKGGEVEIAQPSLSDIKSRVDLEKALVNLLKSSTENSPGSYVSLATFGVRFSQVYGEAVGTVLENLKIEVKFVTLLKSCSAFKLEQTTKGWQVAIA